MEFDEIWALEKSLWLGGPDAYAGLLHPRCLMAFAEMGVLGVEAVIESLTGPRWQAVTPSDIVIAQAANDLIVFGYRASAERADAPPYRCVCTSTYLRSGDRWLVVQHQQSAEA
nr:nuclear transport factor 2 family protein [Brevundimonas diminuta]